MARKRAPIKNMLTTDEPGRVSLYSSLVDTGTYLVRDGDSNMVDEGGGVYKITLDNVVPLNSDMLSDSSVANSKLGSGVTMTFSVTASCFTDLDTVTPPIVALASTPSINSDGQMYFYVQLAAGAGYAGAGIRITTSTRLQNPRRA